MAKPEPGAEIGRRLRAVREERLLSRPVLARRAGVHHITIDHIERGFVARPRRTTLEKLAGPLGVTVEELTGSERPFVHPPAPPLALAAMMQEEDGGARHRALEAATNEELARYLRDISRAVTGAGKQLRSPEHQEPGEQEGLAKYMQTLLDLREEAEPYAGLLPPAAQEMANHASVGAA